jgi:hypothetical protein
MASVLDKLVKKIVIHLLENDYDVDDFIETKEMSAGYLETQTDIKQSLDNVKLQKEPEIQLKTGGNAWADIKGSGTKSKSNPWLDHVKKVKSENPSLKYKDVLKKAKETYSKQGGQIKTQHYYDSRIVDQVKEQKQQQTELKKEAKKPRGRPKKSQVEHQPKTSDFVKTIIKKEKGTKLKVIKPIDFDKNEKPIKLSFEKPKERKYQKTDLDKILGFDSNLLYKKKTKSQPRKVDSEPEKIVQEPLEPRIEELLEPEEQEQQRGRGVLEDDILNLVLEKTKDIKTLAKKQAFTRKFIKEELKKRGLKPIIINQILFYVLTKLEEKKGGVDPNQAVSDASKAVSDISKVIPKSNIAYLVDGLRESGVFSGTKKTIDTLVNRLSDIVNNPGEHRKRLIITRDIPNLKFKLAKKENVYNEKAHRYKDFRKENARIEINNIKAHITALLNRIVGINMIDSNVI